MAVWEQVLLGIGAFLILLFFLPGVKNAMERSREAEERDWAGFLVPMAVVIAFVVLLVFAARS